MDDKNETFLSVLQELRKLNSLTMTDEEMAQLDFNEKSNNDVIEVLKTILIGIDNHDPESRVYTKIKRYFNIS
jgi:hypothetical protein